MGVAVLLFRASFGIRFSLFPCRCVVCLCFASHHPSPHAIVPCGTLLYANFCHADSSNISPSWEYCVVFRFHSNGETCVCYSLNFVFSWFFSCTLRLLVSPMGVAVHHLSPHIDIKKKGPCGTFFMREFRLVDSFEYLPSGDIVLFFVFHSNVETFVFFAR